MHWTEFTGYLASALVLSTFYMRTMIPLRIAAIASNVAFITYGYLGNIYPVLVLHCMLLPLNCLRLFQMWALINKVRTALRSDLSVEWLMPLMTRRAIPSGEVLFRKDDEAHSMFVLLHGSMRVEEVDITVLPGTLIGEIGVFSPAHRRTGTAVCLQDSEIGEIENQKVWQLYYQNPVFGMYLVRLIIDRLLTDLRILSDRVDGANPRSNA
jgi:CRP/FNR family transcriptional regulator, cyclic AMP receptor protein